MANTFTQIYLQFVFAVQDRTSLIRPEWKDELYKYITGIVHNNNHKLIAINGIPNHLHVFVGYKPHQLIPDLLQDMKGDLREADLDGKRDMALFRTLILRLIVW